MATHPDDFQEMRSGIDFAGETLVNHGHHLGDPGPQHPDNRAARAEYEEHIGGPKLVRAVPDVHDVGASYKAFFRGPQRTWMLKPYHETHDSWTSHYPLAGWSELTSQALYHAGGIGHLVQHSHAAMHPTRSARSSPIEQHPMVAIAFHPSFHQPVEKFMGAHLSNAADETVRPTPLYNDAAKVAFMDFLTNHQDRHGNNLLWGWEGNTEPGNLRLLSIDNASAFQYKGAHFDGAHGSPVDHLAHYFTDSHGISGLAKLGMTPWDDEHVLHASNWWLENGPFVRSAFEDHVPAIKDKKVLRHITQSFHDRADALDRFSLAFTAAPKFDLYSPHGADVRARKVAEVKMREHKPIYPW